MPIQVNIKYLCGKIAVFKTNRGIGAFHGFIAGFGGPPDDVLIAGQCGERHELGGTIMRAHVRMRARLVMRQIDDGVVAMGLLQAHAA